MQSARPARCLLRPSAPGDRSPSKPEEDRPSVTVATVDTPKTTVTNWEHAGVDAGGTSGCGATATARTAM